MFANDKIKNVSILPAKPFKDKIMALIIQYEHTILSVSVSSNNYRRLSNPGKMAQEYIIRGQNDRVFYSEVDLDRSTINIIELYTKTLKVKNREIYEMGCQIVGMETDCSNDTIQGAASTIFVLGKDQKLLRLQENTVQERFHCIETYDFTGYDMSGLINNWSQCQLTPRTITFDEFVYEANSEDQKIKKGNNCFYWAEAKHITEKTQVFDLDKNTDRVVFERTKVQ